MPANPPITSGLILWLTAESSVTKDSANRVSGWQDALSGFLQATQDTAAAKPLWVADAFPGKPGLRFDGGQNLFIQTSDLGQNNFTFIALGRATAVRTTGGTTASGQRFLFSQGSTSGFPALSVGRNGLGVYEFGTASPLRLEAVLDASTFCPVTLIYDTKAPTAFLHGSYVGGAGAAPGASVSIPHSIGASFVGDIAEILILQPRPHRLRAPHRRNLSPGKIRLL